MGLYLMLMLLIHYIVRYFVDVGNQKIVLVEVVVDGNDGRIPLGVKSKITKLSLAFLGDFKFKFVIPPQVEAVIYRTLWHKLRKRSTVVFFDQQCLKYYQLLFSKHQV